MKFKTCITYISLLAFSATIYAATSSTYYFKGFPTSGSISMWYTNDNSWGVNAPSGTGFVAMVTGEDWGTWSPVHTLPKKINTISSSHTTWFSQTSSPASGAGYDAWYDTPFLSTIFFAFFAKYSVHSYDIFIDPVAAPTDRNSINEIMIWVGYKAPNSPLSDNYGSDGKPVPWQTNVSLGGASWDVYLYTYVLTTFAFFLF